MKNKKRMMTKVKQREGLTVTSSPPPSAGSARNAKYTVNVGSGDPSRWSTKVNMALAVKYW